jgi:hypothetical protein
VLQNHQFTDALCTRGRDINYINILIKAEYGNILNWKINRILKELTNWVSFARFSDK